MEYRSVNRRFEDGLQLDSLITSLFRRLVSKGVSARAMPGFIGDLANTLATLPRINLEQINRRLQLLGWRDIVLDAHTIEMTIAVMEANSKLDRARRRREWFHQMFIYQSALDPREAKAGNTTRG